MQKRDKYTLIQLAKEQLAREYGCHSTDFDKKENTFIMADDKNHFKIATFGNGAVIKAGEYLYDWCRNCFYNEESKDILDGDLLFKLEKKLRENNRQLAGMNQRYLYAADTASCMKRTCPDGFTLKWYERDEISTLYQDKRFNNALSYRDGHDVLAVIALFEEEIVAMAGADNFKGDFWQIGIDTVTNHRKQGIASYLVSAIAEAIIVRGAIPYYSTWSANIASTSVALNSGFFPAWIDYYAIDV